MVHFQLSAVFVEKAAIGISLAILCLFLLAFAVIAIVIFTISNSCWWRIGVDDRLIFNRDKKGHQIVPIDTVVGETPDFADLV